MNSHTAKIDPKKINTYVVHKDLKIQTIQNIAADYNYIIIKDDVSAEQIAALPLMVDYYFVYSSASSEVFRALTRNALLRRFIIAPGAHANHLHLLRDKVITCHGKFRDSLHLLAAINVNNTGVINATTTPAMVEAMNVDSFSIESSVVVPEVVSKIKADAIGFAADLSLDVIKAIAWRNIRILHIPDDAGEEVITAIYDAQELARSNKTHFPYVDAIPSIKAIYEVVKRNREQIDSEAVATTSTELEEKRRRIDTETASTSTRTIYASLQRTNENDDDDVLVPATPQSPDVFPATPPSEVAVSRTPAQGKISSVLLSSDIAVPATPPQSPKSISEEAVKKSSP